MARPAPVRFQAQFGSFTANLRTGELFRDGIRIKLQDRPFRLLSMLLEHPGEVVTRDEMRIRLWPDGTHVDFDNNISSAMGKLRTSLGDSATAPQYIETLGRRGYRFVAEVSWASPEVEPGAEAAAPALLPGPAAARAHLGWWILLVSLVFVVSVGLVLAYQRSRSREAKQTTAGKIMIAVLPFENLSGDASQEYFSDGFTEEMITQLGRLDPQRVGVIARTSVMRYANTGHSAMQAGSELGVQYVVEGSVRRDGDRVRVAAQLIQARDQTLLWAREYDRDVKDLLTVQSEIAMEITDEVQVALSGSKRVEPARQASLSPQAYEAYDRYIKGRYFWNKRSPEGFRQAIDYFQQAIALKPDYAGAYAGLADTYALMSSYNLGQPGELIPKARAAALKALQLDEGLAEAHTSLALISELYDWDWRTAEKEFRRAIDLDPNYATAHQWYAEFLAFQGRFDEAFTESGRAMQLDPLSLIISADHVAILYYSGQDDLAIKQARGILDMEPKVLRVYAMLVVAYVRMGRFDEASAELGKFRSVDARWLWAMQTFVYGRSGQTKRAREALAKLRPDERHPAYDSPAILAMACAGLEDRDQTLAWLEKAYVEHSTILTSLKVDPVFDFLRGDQRFQNLERRVGLLN